jgi:hypothetical protein
MSKETTLSQDVKTAFVGGCKALVSWIQTFGQVKRGEDRRKVDRGDDRRDKPKRARGVKGRYKGDDLSTAYTNEAWVGGKAPKKRKK